MTREEVYSRLKNVFEDVFEFEVDLNDNTTSADVPGWDSLAHITLMVGIGSEFKIKLPMSEVVHLRNVGEMVTLIMKHMQK